MAVAKTVLSRHGVARLVHSSHGPFGRHRDLGRLIAVEVMMHLLCVDDLLHILGTVAPVTNRHGRLTSMLAHLLLDVFSVLLLDHALHNLSLCLTVDQRDLRLDMLAILEALRVLKTFDLQSIFELLCLRLSQLELVDMRINFSLAPGRL